MGGHVGHHGSLDHDCRQRCGHRPEQCKANAGVFIDRARRLCAGGIRGGWRGGDAG